MRKALVVILILLVVVGGAAFAADRVGLRVAQNEIAKNVRSQYELDHDPQVSIKGFPFLTQALGGEYKEIDIDVGDLKTQGVRLTDATVELKNVRAPMSDAIHGDPSRMVADTAVSTATVGYDEVDREAPHGMKVSADGSALQVHGPVHVLGGARQVTALVTVQAAGRSVRIVPHSVKADGVTVPMGLVRQALSFNVPVKGLPLGTRISQVDVMQRGLRVSATAHDVKLTSLMNLG